MKIGIKKLRTCAFTKAAAPSGFSGQAIQFTNKLVCDHPEMKTDWTEKKCEPCTVYVNRNLPPEPAPPPAPAPPPPEPEAPAPKKTRARKPKTTGGK